MSMLSAQVDELRSMSESVGLAIPQAATLMMEAADTLDSLDLALDSKRIAERRVTELLVENAKLRELVMDYEHCILHVDCDMCMYDGTMSEHCPLSPCFPDIDELRELVVEVAP